MLVGTVSFANTGDPVKELPIVPTTIEKVETVVETPKVGDEALYCSVVIDKYEHTCWFCDCTEFIKALKGASAVQQ